MHPFLAQAVPNALGNGAGAVVPCNYPLLLFALFLFLLAAVSAGILILQAFRYFERTFRPQHAAPAGKSENRFNSRMAGPGAAKKYKTVFGAAGLLVAALFWFFAFSQDVQVFEGCFGGSGFGGGKELSPSPFGEPPADRELPSGKPQREFPLSSPVIDVVGDNPAAVRVGERYADAGATVSYRAEGDLSGSVETRGLPVPTDTPGIYNVTYFVLGDDGSAIQANRTVIVSGSAVPPAPGRAGGVEDGFLRRAPPAPQGGVSEVADGASGARGIGSATGGGETLRRESLFGFFPVILLRGPRTETVSAGELYVDRGVEAFDSRDGDITGSVVVIGLPLDTSEEGVHTVTYAVTDSDGNTSKTTRTIIIESVVDTRTDISYLESCYGKPVSGPCAAADFTGDGTINRFDLEIVIRALAPLDVNDDLRIEAAPDKEINPCAMKLGSECAVSGHGGTIVTKAYLASVLDKLGQSAAPDRVKAISVSAFSGRLSNSVQDKITFSTIAQYDLDGDGVVDFDKAASEDFRLLHGCITGRPALGFCETVDINRDGIVTIWDWKYSDFIQSIFLPESFTIWEFENSLFDAAAYTDARIILHCAENKLDRGNCEKADVNGDGEATMEDVEYFESVVERVDLNGDGVLNGRSSFF